MQGEIVLAPPETLTPPEPVAPVKQEQAVGMVRLDQDTLSGLDTRATRFVEGVVSDSVMSESFKDKLNAIHNLGNEEIRSAASVSNRMLDKPTRAMKSGLFDESSQISQDLVGLRKQVDRSGNDCGFVAFRLQVSNQRCCRLIQRPVCE